MSDARWTSAQVPELRGRTVLVTGANSGIGYEAARMLAVRGAHLVLACRDVRKGEAAARRIHAHQPDARLEVLELDLANLASVRAAAQRFSDGHAHLDVLINNAGVMALPLRRTADGFEMQLGTNHLGHFALTAHLLERLLATPQARVVTVSSGAHHFGAIDPEGLERDTPYHPWRAYAQSKLANLLFSHELARRFECARADAIAVAAHPGAAATQLPVAAPAMQGRKLLAGLVRIATPLVTQSAEMGALPTVRAAADPEVANGAYFGPSGFREMRGFPVLVPSSRRARDPELAARLWTRSEDLTGARFEALAQPSPP